jgi:Na+-translocating ferredoxin:NAD+ oxidoreductase RnfD subunit
VRVGVLHITLAYLASFLILGSLRATLLGLPVLPEIAPVTGPMYQLFVFFMITDPRTVVKGRRKQIVVAILIAIMEALIRYVADRGVTLPTAFSAAPAFLALATVGPAAKWIDLWRNPPRKPSVSKSSAGKLLRSDDPALMTP